MLVLWVLMETAVEVGAVEWKHCLWEGGPNDLIEDGMQSNLELFL